MTQLFVGSEAARPEPIRRPMVLPAGDRLLSDADYRALSLCRVELAGLSVALETGVTDASLRRLCQSAVRRALGEKVEL